MMPKQPAKAGSPYVGLGSASSLLCTTQRRAQGRTVLHERALLRVLLHRWEQEKKSLIFCSLLTKVAPEYLVNSPEIFPHCPANSLTCCHAGICNFSVCFPHFSVGRMEHRKVCNTWGRENPLCSISDKSVPHLPLHQEENGLLGYAFRDYLIGLSTESLCLAVLTGDLVNLWFAGG